MSSPATASVKPFTKFAASVVAYNVLVVLWGAWVRISGSGAGCGEHWPTCNGEIIPLSPSTKTIIEFSHRLTSGLCLVLSLAVAVWAFRAFAKGDRVRTFALTSLGFVILEALLGAGLVLLGLVDKNSSVQRAVVVALHLVNTFGLVGFAALTAFFSHQRPQTLKLKTSSFWLLAAGLGIVLVTSATGGITALGDTLFPVQSGPSMLRRMAEETSEAQHFLVRLRVVHPLVAVAGAFFLMRVLRRLRTASDTHKVFEKTSLFALLFVYAQVIVGAFNVLLSAPGFMQIVHLLVANVLWISLVLTTAATRLPDETAIASATHEKLAA